MEIIAQRVSMIMKCVIAVIIVGMCYMGIRDCKREKLKLGVEGYGHTMAKMWEGSNDIREEKTVRGVVKSKNKCAVRDGDVISVTTKSDGNNETVTMIEAQNEIIMKNVEKNEEKKRGRGWAIEATVSTEKRIRIAMITPGPCIENVVCIGGVVGANIKDIKKDKRRMEMEAGMILVW